jgi:LacI family repressor for deo operon, udp, cdd, tsx, nupC, and nupG
LIEKNKSKSLPIVIGLEPISADLDQFPSVHIDNYQAAYDATQYLITSGHKDIVFVSGPKHSFVTKDRELGFCAAIKSSELSLDEANILHSDLTSNGGVNAAMEIFARSVMPTAIFCANDDMALGVLGLASRRGIRVPEDLSIMGFDDTRYAAIANPPLSTVFQPARDIGIGAAKRLLRAIDSPEDSAVKAEILPHRLVIRSSTGPRG